MKACKDCKCRDYDLCQHEKSIRKMTDYISGTIRTYPESCITMRQGICGKDAKLFEAKPKSEVNRNYNDIISRVSIDFNLTIKDMALCSEEELKDAGYPFYYDNDSAISGSTIFLGIYYDAEHRLVSFFHEVGHTQTHLEYNEGLLVYATEAGAWSKGLEIAARYGVTFSESALLYAHRKLATYTKTRR